MAGGVPGSDLVCHGLDVADPKVIVMTLIGALVVLIVLLGATPEHDRRGFLQ
jgi:hypothetical protein